MGEGGRWKDGRWNGGSKGKENRGMGKGGGPERTVRCSHRRSSMDTFSPTARYLPSTRSSPHDTRATTSRLGVHGKQS
jgi:hypothetical protein